MNVKWRLTLRLVGWLACFGLILLSLSGAVFYWIIIQLAEIQAERDFQTAGLSQLVDTVRAEGKNWTFDPKLLEAIEKTDGWLQRIDDNGKVTDAFFTPPDVPNSYDPGELSDYLLQHRPFPYQLAIWIQIKNGITHTLIYGKTNQGNGFLQQLAETGKRSGVNILLPGEMLEKLKKQKAWLQLLAADGVEIASLNKPEQAISRFSVPEMVLRSIYPDRYGAEIHTKYNLDTRETWVLSTPLPGYGPGEQPVMAPEVQVLAIGIGALVIAAMLLLLVMSYWFGNRIGSPVVHVLNWLRLLDKGQFREPANSLGKPKSLNRSGRRKSKYHVYGDVIHSLESLSGTLRRNEQLQKETEQLRDEWIAGVSHDLKTPLSSIKGYAHMLETDTYDWTTNEVRSFAKVILEKSSHMDALINDLTLTYHLRSGGEAPSKEVVEMNNYLNEVLLETAQHPLYREGGIRFVPAVEPVYLTIYKPWFQRIVDNLVANAFLHNRKGTTLTVSLQMQEAGGVIITFSDNGEGMNEQTADRLFERYFRGIDSESRSEGTGLGMAISKALVEALGAKIELHTHIGEGTSIHISWPGNEEI
ncbi:sensor histidine kinase [Paenibacillus sp. GCM10012307]|uniref:histidine kinase n=1 Tax=Paenibacillus roseus TaxID=2798579 RepID=A0A934J8H8_9BACL|nr:HAMP domain-containing sensor histidine kinase [Paenibacillus roseus]MBJ6363754.1 HAMP domain-containing histidine kinase [Paenibacillus roseus]